jgi:L-lactate dehydrogenase complex protein LldG
VAAYLRSRNLPARLVIARPLQALAWPPSLAVQVRAAGADDAVSVTPCFAAIAETGSVVLLSSPESPTTLNFVPDDHIVVLAQGQIVWHIEDVWQQLRERNVPMPRALNIVSGPSRTADIEQVVQLGAHGPRRLHLVLVEEDLA